MVDFGGDFWVAQGIFVIRIARGLSFSLFGMGYHLTISQPTQKLREAGILRWVERKVQLKGVVEEVG